MNEAQLWNKLFYVEYDDNDFWKNASDRIHFHLSYEIFFLVENKISYFVDDEIYTLTPGSVIVIPPNTIHTSLSVNEKTRKRYLINLPAEYIKAFLDIKPNLLSDMEVQPIIFSGLKLIELTDLFKKILAEYQRPVRDEVMIQSLLGEILTVISRASKSQEQNKASTSPTSQRIMEISNYIKENLQNELSLKKISETFYLNPSYLSRMFKQTLNITFSKYLNALRIREACVLLKETDMNVTEIARKSGFHSCSVFCRMFKRTVKLSPLQYRKNAKE